MPNLVTPDGKPVDVTPPADATNIAFRAAMDDDGTGPEQAPPRRQPAAPAAEPKSRGRGAAKPRAEEKSRTTAPVTALDDKARAQGVQGIAQVVAGIAMMFGKATKKPAFEADAVVIASNADQFADAAVQVAHADAAFAARLDKICAVGPYGALIAVAVGVGSQCARNHGVPVPGTVDPKEILAEAGKQAVPAAA